MWRILGITRGGESRRFYRMPMWWEINLFRKYLDIGKDFNEPKTNKMPHLWDRKSRLC